MWLAALAVAVFQVAGSFGAADNQPERRALDAVGVVLVLLGPAALALRDRFPLTPAAVAMGAAAVFVARGYPYGPIFLSVVVALFWAVQKARRRQVLLVAAAGYASFVAASVVDRRADDVGLVHWSLVAGWLVVVLAVSDLVRTRREQAAERTRAAEEERQRRLGEQRLGLAQELHDVLAHDISLINVQASVALHLLDEHPERARPALTAIKHASHDALHELRAALETLRHGDQAPTTPAPRLTDVDLLVEGVRSSGLDVRFERTAELPPLPGPVELATYRIIQEALTNVTRHAAARAVTVRIGYEDAVTLEVLDDGVGGVAPPGNGIVGMRERAAALGGTVETGPRPGGGFRVAARLPVPT